MCKYAYENNYATFKLQRFLSDICSWKLSLNFKFAFEAITFSTVLI
jgi:hypothetical protein